MVTIYFISEYLTSLYVLVEPDVNLSIKANRFYA